MSPRPDDTTRDQLKSAVTAAMEERAKRFAEADHIRAGAEAAFWKKIDPLRQLYFGAQTDIAEVTGYTRDHILKQAKRHTDGPRGAEESQ
ncbi:hypothetical protein AB0D13_23405 [Streptomyces sp. NPDC048430]|uniref:hypothetical protein n=1 Tax=Streptomyces sp. NPDC048430 TaxID=3155388 RepID=UPI00341C34D8